METCEVGSRVTSLKQRCHSRALTRFVYVQAMQMLPWTVIDLTDEWASHLKGLNTSSAERHDAALTSGTDHDSATDRTTPPPTESARPRKSSVTPRGFGLHLRHRHMSGSRLSLSAMRAMAGSPSGRPPSAHSTRSLRSQRIVRPPIAAGLACSQRSYYNAARHRLVLGLRLCERRWSCEIGRP